MVARDFDQFILTKDLEIFQAVELWISAGIDTRLKEDSQLVDYLIIERTFREELLKISQNEVLERSVRMRIVDESATKSFRGHIRMNSSKSSYCNQSVNRFWEV